ncbi:hypothetical protein K502DRAFT_348999 [Neoconidiobolus thromboides FSU 785]|nr:hypothetical protein K502DRAFT_348999 [Neoconidiobolus thromboides FSU 785]
MSLTLKDTLKFYPQPVQFTAAELRLLFNNASQVVAYCLNKGLDNKLDREVFIRFHKFNAKHQFQSNIHIPFYYQACYCFFALINLLHYSSQLKRQDIFMIDESKTKCFLLVRELDEISKSNNKNQAKDANNALDQIKSHLYRFELPPDLIQKISVYLN